MATANEVEPKSFANKHKIRFYNYYKNENWKSRKKTVSSIYFLLYNWMESEQYGPLLLEQSGRDQSGDRRIDCVVTNRSIEAHAHRGRWSKVAAQKRKKRYRKKEGRKIPRSARQCSRIACSRTGLHCCTRGDTRLAENLSEYVWCDSCYCWIEFSWRHSCWQGTCYCGYQLGAFGIAASMEEG